MDHHALATKTIVLPPNLNLYHTSQTYLPTWPSHLLHLCMCVAQLAMFSADEVSTLSLSSSRAFSYKAHALNLEP